MTSGVKAILEGALDQSEVHFLPGVTSGEEVTPQLDELVQVRSGTMDLGRGATPTPLWRYFTSVSLWLALAMFNLFLKLLLYFLTLKICHFTCVNSLSLYYKPLINKLSLNIEK